MLAHHTEGHLRCAVCGVRGVRCVVLIGGDWVKVRGPRCEARGIRHII